MQGRLTKRIGELLMDMDDAPQAASSVAVNGQNVPMSYGQGDHHVELAYLTPAEQTLLADVDMYDSNPPHPGPAGIPNFNDSGNGGGGGGGGNGNGDGDGDGDAGQGGIGADAGFGGGEGEPGDPGGFGGDAPGGGDFGGVASAASAAQASDPAADAAAAVAEAEADLGSDVDFDITDPTEDVDPASAISLGGFPGADNTISEAEIQGLTSPMTAEVITPWTVIEKEKEKARNILQVQSRTRRNPFFTPRTQRRSRYEAVISKEQARINATRAKAHKAIADAKAHQAKSAKEGNAYAHLAFNDDEVAAIMAVNAMNISMNANATDDEGNLNELGLSLAGQDLSKGGFGSLSPAGFNANSSEAARNYQNAIEEGKINPTESSEISLQSLVDINFDTGLPGKGYDINEPQPSAGGILASHHWARYNPTMTNALFGIGSLVPGPAGMVAQAAGIKEGKGFGPLAMQAIENVPVIGDLATDFQGWLGEVGTQLGGLLPGEGALGGLMAATDQGQDLSLADMPDFGEAPGEGEPEGPGDPVFEYSSPPLPEDVVVGPQPQQPQPEQEERPLLAAGPLLSPLLPPALPLAPEPTFGAVNLPPVFTEEDARALLQRSGQLPFAGIV